MARSACQHFDTRSKAAEEQLCGLNVTLPGYDDFQVLQRLGERGQLGSSVEVDAKALEACEVLKLFARDLICIETEIFEAAEECADAFASGVGGQAGDVE
mmetsp:Transcript_41539/g.96960  ORF Transcript_41539/g.96960 Transcript_41539/m.96960 type:complete len:100 (-) Transcript_41539:198-497(-)